MYFLTTNQLFCFRFDIDKVIRLTYTHALQRKHRDIHTFLHTYMNSYIKTSGPIIPSTTDNRKIILIHSGYFYSASISPLLLRGAPDNRYKKRFLRFLD